jgi:hypothetical protein
MTKIERAHFTAADLTKWRERAQIFHDADVWRVDGANQDELKSWLAGLVDANDGNSLFVVRSPNGHICVTSNSEGGMIVACFIRDALKDATKAAVEIQQLRAALALAKHNN